MVGDRPGRPPQILRTDLQLPPPLKKVSSSKSTLSMHAFLITQGTSVPVEQIENRLAFALNDARLHLRAVDPPSIDPFLEM